MSPLSTALISLAGGLLTGGVTAILTVTLALRRFRSERWWDRKAHAYSELFVALVDIQTYTSRLIDEIESNVGFQDAYMAELSKRSSEGRAIVRRAAALGIFAYSDEVARRLLRLQNQLDTEDPNNDPLEDLYEDFRAASSALEDLRPMALRDLRLAVPSPRGDPSTTRAA